MIEELPLPAAADGANDDEAQPAPAAALPEAADPGSIEDLIDRLEAHLGVVAIDEVWQFPARKAGTGESTLFVVSAFEADPQRRRVLTAQFAVSRDAKGTAIVEESIEVQASAPAERVARVIDGVMRRLGDELSVPRYAHIAGGESAWLGLRSQPQPAPGE